MLMGFNSAIYKTATAIPVTSVENETVITK